MTLPTFLKLFAGAKMSSLEFEKLKNRVTAASVTITSQNRMIAELSAKLATATTPVVAAITDADYAELTKTLDDALVPASTPAKPTILPQADPAHPNLQG